MMSFEFGDIVNVPFPFIDSGATKLRPALMLSTSNFQKATGACVLAMITSAERSRWDNDIALSDWACAGLRKPSIIRWKLFTLDEALIVDLRGKLAPIDKAVVQQALINVFSGWNFVEASK